MNVMGKLFSEQHRLAADFMKHASASLVQKAAFPAPVVNVVVDGDAPEGRAGAAFMQKQAEGDSALTIYLEDTQAVEKNGGRFLDTKGRKLEELARKQDEFEKKVLDLLEKRTAKLEHSGFAGIQVDQSQHKADGLATAIGNVLTRANEEDAKGNPSYRRNVLEQINRANPRLINDAVAQVFRAFNARALSKGGCQNC